MPRLKTETEKFPRKSNIFKILIMVKIGFCFLPECIWESIATRKIAKGSGKTLDDYRDALDDFSPIRNLDNLKAGRIEVHLGVSDKMIPYQRGRELVDEMKVRKVNLSTTIYSFSGHCEAIIRFARNFAISK